MSPYKLVQNERWLSSQPSLARSLGDKEARFLSHLHYWIQSGKSGLIHNGLNWIFNTHESWAHQLCISARHVRRIIKRLVDFKIVLVDKLSSYKSNRTNYYTIDYVRLSNMARNTFSDTEKVSVVEESNAGGSKSASSGQNVRMVKTRYTNKTYNNLIEETATKGPPKVIGVTPQKYQNETFRSVEQVDQVHKLINEKRGEGASYDKAVHKTTTAQDMLSIWNKHFPKSQAVMTKDLARYLVSTYKRLDTNIDKWRHYCTLIESSPYLTGETFSLSIQWAIKFSTIDRILNGEFQVSRRNLSYVPSDDILMQQSQEHISSLKEIESLESLHLRHLILKKFGAATYQSWFTKIQLGVSKGIVTIEAESQFAKEYVRNKFLCVLEREQPCLKDCIPPSICGVQNAA